MGILDWFRSPKSDDVSGGIRGTAHVVSLAGHRTKGIHRWVKMNVVLNAEGVTPTATTYEGFIDHGKIPYPGQTLPASIDPKDPTRFSILWDDIPDSDVAAQQAAQALAAALAGDASALPTVLGSHTFSSVQVVGDVNSVTPEQKAKLAAFGIDLDALVRQSGTVTVTPTPPSTPDPASALERLAALHAAGSLTDAEFAEAKRKVLAPPAG